MKPFRRFRVQFQQNAPRFVLSIFVRPAALFHDWNADTRSEFAHGRWKIDMLVFHNETKGAPSHAAAKTMERLPLRADVERWRFLLMKWTERLEIRPGALEREIRSDHLDDIVRGGDLLDRV